MFGLIVIVLLSVILLYAYHRSVIDGLGFLPRRERLADLSIGVMLATLSCAGYFGLQVWLSSSLLEINPAFRSADWLKSGWWVLRSVLFEELLFRGALLYLAIRFLGTRWAIFLSALAFGVYHWFSYGIFGNYSQMFFVFLLTFMAGLVFAWCFARTKSIYLQTGLHFGWNLVVIIVFSQGPLETQWLIVSDGYAIGTAASLGIFAFQVLALPLAAWVYLQWCRHWR